MGSPDGWKQKCALIAETYRDEQSHKAVGLTRKYVITGKLKHEKTSDVVQEMTTKVTTPCYLTVNFLT